MIGRSSKTARVPSPAAWLVIGAVMVVVLGAWRVRAWAADLVIPAGREAEIVGVVAPYRLGGEVAEGFHLDGIQVGQRRIDFVLATMHEPAERVTVVLTAGGSAAAAVGLGRASSLSVDPPDEQQSPAARRAAATLVEVVAQNADRAFWDRVLGAPEAGLLPMARGAAPFVAVAAVLVVLGMIVLRSPGAPRGLVRVWARWAAPTIALATALALPLAVGLLTRSGAGDAEAASPYLQMLQREFARCALWVAVATCAAVGLSTLVRARAEHTRVRLATAAAVTVDAVAVMAWSAFVRFVLTQPNILTDGGSGYGRLWRMAMAGWQGLSVLIEALFPEDPRFMWTVIRVPWVLAAFAPPLLLLLGRALGFGRARALLAGIALASLPLHAAMYASDFEFGPLLSFNLLGLALVAAAVRFERAELAPAGAAVLAYTCWGRPDAPIVGAALLAIALPALRRWRMQPEVVAALGWFAVNAVASFASARVLGAGGSHLTPHLWLGFPVLLFVGLQEIVPFWLLLPLPFGVVSLLRRDPWRLVVVGIGVAAGLVPLSLSPIGEGDPTQSYMEYFRYGTWALPWIVLVAAEGMEVGVGFMGRLLARGRPEPAPRVAFVARATIVAVCMATPLYFRSYLAREYGPRAEEAVFREVLARVPDACGLVVPDDESDDQGGGTIEIMRRYVYIAEEAAAQGAPSVNARRIVGVTEFLRAAAEHHAVPPSPSPSPSSGPSDTDRAQPCWYYFRGSYCYTGLIGRGSPACDELERDAVLTPTLTRSILYIWHRMVTRPDVTEPPLYDPAQSLVLSKIVGWRTDGAAAATAH